MNSNFQFTQKVTGHERKAIASVIAEALETEVQYAGVPSFAYTAGGWSVDKDSVVHSPEIALDAQDDFTKVMDALSLAGLTTQGNLSVILPETGHTPKASENLIALIQSKGDLLKKALHTDADISVKASETQVFFKFFIATLKTEEILAFAALAVRLLEMAKTLKYVSAKEKEVDNEKYAFRCFLLRLGFIGSEHKAARKVLLQNLEGNSAFKSGERNAVTATESEVASDE